MLKQGSLRKHPATAAVDIRKTRTTMHKTRHPDRATVRRSKPVRQRAAAASDKPVARMTPAQKIGAAILVLAILLIAIGTATAHEYTAKNITVAHPWARATPAGVTVGGAYFEIKAAAGQGDRLIGARSPVAGAVEIHSHEMQNGVAVMRRVEVLPIKGGTSVVLGPGGYHVMLMGLKQPLKEGDMLKLTLSFERAGDIEVDATIEPVGAKGPHGIESKPATGKIGGHQH